MQVHLGCTTAAKPQTNSNNSKNRTAVGKQPIHIPIPPAPKVSEPESKPESSPGPSLPVPPCDVKIETDSNQHADPKPNIKIESDSTDNAKRLPLEGVSRSFSPTVVIYDLTEFAAEKMQSMPITISESDYERAVTVDLPSIETPSPNPES